MGYQLKQKPEDFIVIEISNVKIDKGRYSYYKLIKKNRNTLDVVKELAKQLKIKEKSIGFAGSKDKHAITEQIISLQASKENVNKVKIDNVSLQFIGSGNEPITLGKLEGNYFEITVRDTADFTANKMTFLENYFDEQRFSKNNVQIGKALIKKEFKEATYLIDDNLIKNHLKINKNDYVGALKKLPLRILKFYVHSYQSYLWNELVANYLRKNHQVEKEIKYSLGKFVFVSDPKNSELPLIGFATKLTREIQQILKKEDLNLSDFVIKQIPELSMEGDLREVFVEIEELRIKKEQNKILLKFILPKGSYATMAIKKIIKQKI